jgi:hypothetical protein
MSDDRKKKWRSLESGKVRKMEVRVLNFALNPLSSFPASQPFSLLILPLTFFLSPLSFQLSAISYELKTINWRVSALASA